MTDKKAQQAAKQAARRKAARNRRVIKWAAIVAVAGGIGYGLSQMSSVAYTDRDIKVVDFSGLDRAGKKEALEAANRARCPCGCGMTLAQCVSTDSTCPIRETNIQRIKTMVVDAMAAHPGS